MEDFNILQSGYVIGESTCIHKNNHTILIQYYQKEHSNEYKLMEIEHGKPNGKVELYKNGIIKQTWKERNGVREGDFYLYKNGCLYLKQSWDNYFGDGDHIQILNTVDGDCIQIVDRCTNHIIFRGECNKRNEKHGFGYEFDRETGKVKNYSFYKKDIWQYTIQDFNEDVMVEYLIPDSAKKENRQIPCYSGGYIEDNGYKRHGIGYIIDRGSRRAKYQCEYNKGVEIRRCQLDQGKFVGSNYEEAEKFEERREENHSVLISSNLNCLSSLHYTLSSLTIAEGSYNDEQFTKFHLTNFPALESLTVEANSCSNVLSFMIDGLSNLEIVIINELSFQMIDQCFEQTNCQITNCGSLQTIKFGQGSFTYCTRLELRSTI